MDNDPQTMPTDFVALGRSACELLCFTSTVTIYYYYSAPKAYFAVTWTAVGDVDVASAAKVSILPCVGPKAVSKWKYLSKKVSDKFVKRRNQNRPSLFAGQMSQEATKPGFSFLCCSTFLLIGEGVLLLS